MLKYQLKNQVLKWSVEPISYDRFKDQWIIIFLMLIHGFNFFVSRMLIGTRRFHSAQQREQFPRKFKILTAILIVTNVGVAIVSLPSVMVNYPTMGNYYKLWIIADVLLLFLTQLNIYIEYKCNERNDQVIAEFVYDKIQASINESIRNRLGSMISGDTDTNDAKKGDVKDDSDIVKLNL